MKRAVMTALAVSLLSGTSALAQDANNPVARMARQMVERNGGERPAPPPREARPQQAPAPQAQAPQERAPQAQASQSRADRGGGSDGRGRPSAGATRPRDTQGQRPTNLWQGQGRPDNPPAAAAQAQRPQGQGQRPGGQAGAGRPDNRPGQGRPDQYNPRPNDPPVVGVAQNMVQRLERERERERDRDRYDNRRPGWDNDRYDRDDRYDRRPVIRPEDRWDRDHNRPRYDQRRYPRYVTPQQRYRWIGPSYRQPPGFYSFRWQWGQTLPWNWYTPNYYLNDYWRYGLPMPPIGCEWVRVGDDAILVDVFTGRVYQVVYNLFW